MRLAIFSDIHGNLYALNAVLNAIAKEGPFDVVIAAGDISLGGSDPAGCVDLLREAGVLAVYGNTDKYLTEPENPPPDELHLKKWNHLRPQVDWALTLLGEDRTAWLRSLPFALQISPLKGTAFKGTAFFLTPGELNDRNKNAIPGDDLLVFHANPKNIIQFIFPPPDLQPKYFGEILQPDDSEELSWLMEGVTARTCAFGHMHITSIRNWRDYTLVNVAPCSMPALEKDPRARYTIFEWKNNKWIITQRFVEYDYKLEVAALYASGIPFVEDFVETFP
jgi:predicted phosphodiesterase